MFFNILRKVKNKIVQRLKVIQLQNSGVKIGNDFVCSGDISIGKNSIIEPYNRIIADGEVHIGKNFYLNVNCHLLGEIRIGDNVMIGPKTIIWGRDHSTSLDLPMNKQPHIKKRISIGNDVWIGAGVIILKGVIIESGSVIGAGSVVTKNVLRDTIVAGNPARVIKKRE